MMGRYTLFLSLFLTLFFISHSVRADKLSPSLEAKKQSLVGLPVHIRIFKEESSVELYVLKKNKFQLVDTYPICHFSGGLGPKKRENDLKSPEGFYQANVDNLNPNSQFHLSFNIGYPNLFDQSHGYTGYHLMVHGGCASTGCYAIGDESIEEVYHFVEQAIANGQQNIDIHIYPFKMTEKNMQRHRLSNDYDFWLQLKPAYDYFEKNKLPPFIYISNGKYFVYHHLQLQSLSR